MGAVIHFQDKDENGSLPSKTLFKLSLPDTTRSYLPFKQKPRCRRFWICDYPSLANLLESCGFANIEKETTMQEMCQILIY